MSDRLVSVITTKELKHSKKKKTSTVSSFGKAAISGVTFRAKPGLGPPVHSDLALPYNKTQAALTMTFTLLQLLPSPEMKYTRYHSSLEVKCFLLIASR